MYLMENDYGEDYGGRFVRHEPRRTIYTVIIQSIEKRILELDTYTKKDNQHFGF